MQTIQACVSPRLLTKADRLFTGTLEGRIIEVLQNARRAGATEVVINNANGCVTVRDNGRGIEDFSKLLDLGGSGWEESFEASEDPAGVGIFCLAPRELTIRSNGKVATISEDGWTGEPVTIQDDTDPTEGSVLRFKDEEWTATDVNPFAAFCGMNVTVDGDKCPQLPFIPDAAANHPELGCRIEVRLSNELTEWHRVVGREVGFYANALVSFHGQVVGFNAHPIGEQGLHYLVDLTGEPTGIRLMLPARTRLVENDAFDQLKAAIELEAFRYVQRRGHHRLSYKEYMRARRLGIELPEAKPTNSVGLLSRGDPPEPVEVVMPKGFPLKKCYHLDPMCEGEETDETNVHLLAALGQFETPFIPVDMGNGYDDYSWAKLPTIGKVELTVGEKLQSRHVWGGRLTCVESLAITAHASDGRVFTSPVCMAVSPPKKPDSPAWEQVHVLVTREAETQLTSSHIWHHFGGWCDDGDTYETQEFEFEQQLDRFWADLVGPDEHLRQNLFGQVQSLEPQWKTVTIAADGSVVVAFADGQSKQISAPSVTT